MLVVTYLPLLNMISKGYAFLIIFIVGLNMKLDFNTVMAVSAFIVYLDCYFLESIFYKYCGWMIVLAISLNTSCIGENEVSFVVYVFDGVWVASSMTMVMIILNRKNNLYLIWAIMIFNGFLCCTHVWLKPCVSLLYFFLRICIYYTLSLVIYSIRGCYTGIDDKLHKITVLHGSLHVMWVDPYLLIFSTIFVFFLILKMYKDTCNENATKASSKSIKFDSQKENINSIECNVDKNISMNSQRLKNQENNDLELLQQLKLAKTNCKLSDFV